MTEPKTHALLEAYREVSELDDQPAPEVFERLQAEIEAEAVTEPPRRAAAWVIAGVAAAASVAAVIAWPRPELQMLQSDAPVSTAVDRARSVVPTPAPAEPRPRPAPRIERPDPQPEEPPPEPAPAVRARTPPEVAPARDDDLLRELALLRKARQAMQRDELGAARAALRSHRKMFASGQLAEDRDALWVIVRCREGSNNTGHAAFEAAHPSSHHLVAIRAACEKK